MIIKKLAIMASFFVLWSIWQHSKIKNKKYLTFIKKYIQYKHVTFYILNKIKMRLKKAPALSMTPPTGPGWDSWDLEKVIESTKQEMVEKLSSDTKEYFVQKMGANFHEEWRKGYAANPENVDTDWKVRPRIKQTKDKEWAELHGTDMVDIYYTPFKDLPLDRKKDNLEAAKVVIDLVYDKIVNGEEITLEMVEEMSSVVHEAWMERNSWEKESRPHLFVPYEELSEEEKAKDRAQVETAIRLISKEKVKWSK